MVDNLIPYDGEINIVPAFFSSQEADAYYAGLSSEIDWQQEDIMIVGKTVTIPRLMCWYGDPGAVYRYSGVRHEPLPWTQDLSEIRWRIEDYCGHPFNSVLGNLYRSGDDSMGWHADKEKELGVNPVIASVSFGEQRLFRLRHNKTRATIHIELKHGDLLKMHGALQHHWRHCIPKTRKTKQPRINLTFRRILDCC